jgi:bacteriorhodopsin
MFATSTGKVSVTTSAFGRLLTLSRFITTPLLLLDLLLTAGMPWPTVLWVILVDWVMIVTGLVGALVTSSYKWGYFTFGE